MKELEHKISTAVSDFITTGQPPQVLVDEIMGFIEGKKRNQAFANDVLESLFGAWDHKPEDEETIIYHNKRGYRTSMVVRQMKKTIQEKYDLWHNAVG